MAKQIPHYRYVLNPASGVVSEAVPGDVGCDPGLDTGLLGELLQVVVVLGCPESDEFVNPKISNEILTDYLGENAGGKMKATGTARWLSPNTGATNESGFNGLPGGVYAVNTGFYGLGEYGAWWSTTQDGSVTTNDAAMTRYLNHNRGDSQGIIGYIYHGFSVRCVMD